MEIPYAALTPLPTLGDVLGAGPQRLLMLREDLIGIGGGGNKVRKAERAVSRAAADGVRRIVTTGAQQSNHARAVALAAARHGLDCVLVLEGTAPDIQVGNLLLEALAGAHIEWAGGRDAGRLAAEYCSDADSRLIPFGGSDADAVTVYAEVGTDLKARVPELDRVVVALGSGATAAGLMRTLGTERVLAVDTGAVLDPTTVLRHLLAIPTLQPSLDQTQVGSGYEHLQPAVLDAVQLFLRTEGIVLDGTYAGRAAAALIDQYRTGEFTREHTVVLVHTGGVPGLFGHPDLLRPTAQKEP